MRLPLSLGNGLLFLLFGQNTIAHSWVEQINLIAPNGTMVGAAGYPRGNSPRGAGFNEAQMVHLIPQGRPDVLPSDNICGASQRQYEANPASPRLKASPGQAVALRYQENGHVTIPGSPPGKPPKGGVVFVYGTSNPSPNDALMSIHRQWTADGKGGDGRGRLLGTANYDDGQCYQINDKEISKQRQQQFKHAFVQPQGDNLWCQTDVLLPNDLPAGKAFTLYWVWDWPTMPGTAGLPQGKQELYTTCMDIDIIARTGNNQGTLANQAYNYVQQDVINAAVPGQIKQLGNAMAIPNPPMIAFKGQPASGGSNAQSKGPPPSTLITTTKPPPPSTVPPANKPTTGTGTNSGNNSPQSNQPQGNRPSADNGSRKPGDAAPGKYSQ